MEERSKEKETGAEGRDKKEAGKPATNAVEDEVLSAEEGELGEEKKAVVMMEGIESADGTTSQTHHQSTAPETGTVGGSGGAVVVEPMDTTGERH